MAIDYVLAVVLAADRPKEVVGIAGSFLREWPGWYSSRNFPVRLMEKFLGPAYPATCLTLVVVDLVLGVLQELLNGLCLAEDFLHRFPPTISSSSPLAYSRFSAMWHRSVRPCSPWPTWWSRALQLHLGQGCEGEVVGADAGRARGPNHHSGAKRTTKRGEEALHRRRRRRRRPPGEEVLRQPELRLPTLPWTSSWKRCSPFWPMGQAGARARTAWSRSPRSNR